VFTAVMLFASHPVHSEAVSDTIDKLHGGKSITFLLYIIMLHLLFAWLERRKPSINQVAVCMRIIST
jgi:hypothetical protein